MYPNKHKGLTLLVVIACLSTFSCTTRKASPVPQSDSRWPLELGAAEEGSTVLSQEDRALGYFLRAEMAMNDGNRQLATENYEKAIALDPKSQLLRQRLGFLYVRGQRLPEALEQIEEAVSLDPEDATSRLLLAGILSAVGREDEGVSEYGRVIELDPENQEAYLLLGALYGKRGELGSSIDTLVRLTEVMPDQFLAHYSLGRAYAVAENFEPADEAYQEALRLAPPSEQASIMADLAALREVQKRPEEAIELYKRSAQYRSREYSGSGTLGTCLRRAETPR